MPDNAPTTTAAPVSPVANGITESAVQDKPNQPALNLPPELMAALFKSGFRTSEFWITLLALLLLNAGAITGHLPQHYAAVIDALAPIIYQAIRQSFKSESIAKALDAATSTPPANGQ